MTSIKKGKEGAKRYIPIQRLQKRFGLGYISHALTFLRLVSTAAPRPAAVASLAVAASSTVKSTSPATTIKADPSALPVAELERLLPTSSTLDRPPRVPLTSASGGKKRTVIRQVFLRSAK